MTKTKPKKYAIKFEKNSNLNMFELSDSQIEWVYKFNNYSKSTPLGV